MSYNTPPLGQNGSYSYQPQSNNNQNTPQTAEDTHRLIDVLYQAFQSSPQVTQMRAQGYASEVSAPAIQRIRNALQNGTFGLGNGGIDPR